MADELNIPIHRWYEPRNNISLPNSDFSKQWIYDSGIQKIDRWINSQPWGNPINALFALNEPGVWFDPSDLTTLYQDPAGTTPVTAPGNTVGLMLDKSKGLALGAELVANGTFDTNITGWTADGSYPPASAVWSSGSMVVTGNAGNHSAVKSPMTTVVGKSYRITASVTGLGYTSISNSSTGGWSPLSAVGYFVATATTTYIVAAVQPIVGAVATFDNISVRELAGNHATQATLAARPTYSIEPVGGRRNLLTYSEQFDVNAAWNVGNTASKLPNTEIAPDGTLTADTITYGTGTSLWFGYDTPLTLTAGQPYTFSVWIKRKSGTGQLQLNIDPYSLPWNNVAITSSWQRFSITQTPTSTGAPPVICGLLFVASAADEIYLWGAQLELGSTATAYQKVTTQHDVTEAGVASLGYLYFDGTDDAMVTSTITPGTDKVQVFAGVRKLSTFANVVAETSANSDVNNGAFALGTNSSGGLNYLVQARGTNLAFYIPAGYPTPSTDVISGLLDVAGATLAAEIVPRINGVVNQTGGGGGNVGTGNFLAYPLYLGGRAGTSFLFTGHLYSLITRFGPTLDAATITSTEIWVGDKTGIDVAKIISTTIYTRSGDTILDRANSTIERRAV